MFTKIYNLIRQATTRNNLTNEGYLPYFEDDSFPLKWAKYISESPSATSCLSTVADFLEGFGFSGGKDLETKIVNANGETFFQIHQQTCKDLAANEGFYWLMKYNALSQTTEWYVLPFENCRLGKPDDNGVISKIYYNPFFGTKEYTMSGNKKRTKIYDVYNLKGIKEQQIDQTVNYKGQVFFFGTTTAISRFYPVHEAFSSVKWMRTEAGIADYHEDNINNGLLQPYILVQRGDPSAPSTNPDFESSTNNKPVTVGEEFDNVMSSNFMGAKRVGNVMVQWVNIGEEIPQVIPLPTNANGDLFVTLDNQATKKITVAWKVPGILANIQEGTSLGGDANQVRVAVKLMQQRVIKKQRILTDSYQMVLRNFVDPYKEEITIVQYNPYPELEVLDDKIWNELTPDERREWIQDNTEIDLLQDDGTMDQPALPATNFKNAIPVGFPEKVISNVKRALDYMDKMQLKCGGKGGREASEMIANNTSMGIRQLKRIHSYLKKREKYANSPYNEGCEVILYHSWGGKDMFDFLDSKLKELDSWLN